MARIKKTTPHQFIEREFTLETQEELDTLYWALKEAAREDAHYSFNEDLAQRMMETVAKETRFS